MTDFANFDPDFGRGLPELPHNDVVQDNVSAWIVLDDYTQARSVQVRDICAKGAWLQVGGWGNLPDTFYLLVKTTPGDASFRVECVQHLRQDEVVGVKFRRPLSPALLAGVVRQQPEDL